jgi:preprotein translocase subunit SecG
MRRLRTFILLALPTLALLVFADPALAVTHGGEGLFGPTNDVNIVNMMFLLIGFFPAVIIVLSIYQSWADNRRHKKFHAEQAAMRAHEDRGGW